jgi:hypothetical protein
MQTRTPSGARSEQPAKNQKLISWCIGEDLLCLRIELSDGSQFMLPYGYFEGAVFSKDSGFDLIDLQFKFQTFRLKGLNLQQLFFAFQNLAVEVLKEQSSRYRPLAPGNEGFIDKIEIKNTADGDMNNSTPPPAID